MFNGIDKDTHDFSSYLTFSDVSSWHSAVTGPMSPICRNDFSRLTTILRGPF